MSEEYLYSPRSKPVSVVEDRVYKSSPTSSYVTTSSSTIDRPISYERVSSQGAYVGRPTVAYSSEPISYERPVSYERIAAAPVSYNHSTAYSYGNGTLYDRTPSFNSINSVSYERYSPTYERYSPTSISANTAAYSYSRAPIVETSTSSQYSSYPASAVTYSSSNAYGRVPVVESPLSAKYQAAYERPSVISYERSVPGISYERRRSVERLADAGTYERYAPTVSYERPSVIYDQPLSSGSYAQPASTVSYARTIPASSGTYVNGASYPYETVRSTSPGQYAGSRATTTYAATSYERSVPAASSYEWPSSSTSLGRRAATTVYRGTEPYSTASVSQAAAGGAQYASYPSRASYTSYSATAADPSVPSSRVYAAAF